MQTPQTDAMAHGAPAFLIAALAEVAAEIETLRMSEKPDFSPLSRLDADERPSVRAIVGAFALGAASPVLVHFMAFGPATLSKFLFLTTAIAPALAGH